MYSVFTHITIICAAGINVRNAACFLVPDVDTHSASSNHQLCCYCLGLHVFVLFCGQVSVGLIVHCGCKMSDATWLPQAYNMWTILSSTQDKYNAPTLNTHPWVHFSSIRPQASFMYTNIMYFFNVNRNWNMYIAIFHCRHFLKMLKKRHLWVNS